jgi:hypothetical protein
MKRYDLVTKLSVKTKENIQIFSHIVLPNTGNLSTSRDMGMQLHNKKFLTFIQSCN